MKLTSLWIVLLSLAGIPQAQAQAQPDSSQIDSPRYIIEKIECRGNDRTSCDYMRRKLGLALGAPVSDDAIQNARLRLFALPNFSTVNVRLEKGSAPGKVILIVEVSEASPIATEIGLAVHYQPYDQIPGSTGGITTKDYFGRISHQNLFGRQKIVALSVRSKDDSYHIDNAQRGYSRSRSASLVYIDPSVMGWDRLFLSLAGNYGDRTGHVEYQFDNTPASPGNTSSPIGTIFGRYAGHDFEWHMSMGLRLWEYSYVSVDFDNTHDLSHLSADTSAPVGGYPTLSRDDSRASNWSLTVGHDSEDDAYFPTRGIRFSAVGTYLTGHDYYYDSSGYSAHASSDRYDWYAAYKQSWPVGKSSVLSVNVGGEPAQPSDRLSPVQNSTLNGLGITYSYILGATDTLGGIRRGRWYVKVTTGPFDLRRNGRIGGSYKWSDFTVGVRIESRHLGYIDLTGSYFHNWSN